MPHDIDLSRTTVWTRRYGDDAGAPQGPWNETIARLLGHRSVRAYARQAPPPGTLETLIAAAQSAATSSNLQTWSVIAVDDKDARAALAAIANDQAHVAQCPIFLVWLADLSRLQRLGTANGARLEGLDYLEMFLVAAIDAALAAQNAVVAAESLGLATVYIGALRNDVRRVAALLGLPPGAAPVFGLCIGYEAAGAAAEVKPRLPQDVVLHRGRYAAHDEAARIADYDRILAGFSLRNEMSNEGWTKRVLARVGSVAALRGRDALRAALAALGFPLR
ncbi:MAG: nitroreductase family protein [Alphaproteobacteria bacterium]|nr:nitroreductase family protein [Alphaproteobacteria bacterium]